MLTITNDRGLAFNVRVVLQGEKYGLEDRLTHDKLDPLVEFYDTRYVSERNPLGQMVQRYSASTLATHPTGHGLLLDGGIPDWRVDGAALAPVVALCKAIGRA